MKISEILDFLESEQVPFTYRGDKNTDVEGFSSLSHYKSGSFTWVKRPENLPADYDCRQVTLAFVSEGVAGDFPNVIETVQSKHAFFSTMEHFYAQPEERPAIGQFTYLSPKVKLGKNVRIGHNCTLDGDITIGDNTMIWNGVTIVNRVHIGQRCEVKSGAVIGQDGYAFTEDEDHVKTMVKHFGGVTIGNDVLVGENTVISRGTIDDTILEDGVKIDALCHIAHNGWLETNSNMSGPCRNNGSVHIGKNVYIACGLIRNQCRVGDNAFIGLGAVVVSDVPANTTVAGVPARPFHKKEK